MRRFFSHWLSAFGCGLSVVKPCREPCRSLLRSLTWHSVTTTWHSSLERVSAMIAVMMGERKEGRLRHVVRSRGALCDRDTAIVWW